MQPLVMGVIAFNSTWQLLANPAWHGTQANPGRSLPYPGRVLPQHVCMRRMLEERDVAQLPRPQIVQEAAQRKDVTALVIGLTPRHLRQK